MSDPTVCCPECNGYGDDCDAADDGSTVGWLCQRCGGTGQVPMAGEYDRLLEAFRDRDAEIARLRKHHEDDLNRIATALPGNYTVDDDMDSYVGCIVQSIAAMDDALNQMRPVYEAAMAYWRAVSGVAEAPIPDKDDMEALNAKISAEDDTFQTLMYRCREAGCVR